jgi:hypothetical protein
MYQTAEASGLATLHPAATNTTATLRKMIDSLVARESTNPETLELLQLLSDPAVHVSVSTHAVTLGGERKQPMRVKA